MAPCAELACHSPTLAASVLSVDAVLHLNGTTGATWALGRRRALRRVTDGARKSARTALAYLPRERQRGGTVHG